MLYRPVKIEPYQEKTFLGNWITHKDSVKTVGDIFILWEWREQIMINNLIYEPCRAKRMFSGFRPDKNNLGQVCVSTYASLSQTVHVTRNFIILSK